MERTQPSEQAVALAQDGKLDEACLGGLDKIREILFGAIYHELDRRLVRADMQLSARTHELEQEHRRRTEVLETYLKKETEALLHRLEREFIETNETLRKTTREHREAFTTLEQKIGKLEESSAAEQRELRHQLLQQAKTFLDELQALRKELLNTVQQELGLAEGQFGEEVRETGPQAMH
jgi:DNA mismatch repair ATPase MutS